MWKIVMTELLTNSGLRVTFFKNGTYSMQDWTATTRHGFTKKRNTKRVKHTGNMFRKNLQMEGVY